VYVDRRSGLLFVHDQDNDRMIPADELEEDTLKKICDYEELRKLRGDKDDEIYEPEPVGSDQKAGAIQLVDDLSRIKKTYDDFSK